MLICEGNNNIEVVCTERVPDHLPTPGDTRLVVRVCSRGFGGEGWAWVEVLRLRHFVEQLRELEARRSGSAQLESMSPGEFRLRVFATDRAGHMALAGRLAQGEQALEFGFNFCPGLLPEMVAAFEDIAEGRAEQTVAPDGAGHSGS